MTKRSVAQTTDVARGLITHAVINDKLSVVLGSTVPAYVSTLRT